MGLEDKMTYEQKEEIARLQRLQRGVNDAIRLIEDGGVQPRHAQGWPAELLIIGPFIIFERRGLGVTHYPLGT